MDPTAQPPFQTTPAFGAQTGAPGPADTSLSHVVGDQSAVLTFLGKPQTHGLTADARVTRIDTHGAIVFLAGPLAYKVKRAVCFPFMDFSTLARREEACRAEIAINKPVAPEIYEDVVAVTRDAGGALAVNGRGEPIEWVVLMRRFDDGATFDHLAESGRLTDADLDGAVDAILAWQRQAPPRRVNDWIEDLRDYIEQNDCAFHEAHSLFGLKEAGSLTSASKTELTRIKPLLNARGAARKVRRCHGDAHLRNLVRLPEGVRLFDAVEFDDSIATGDILYDLAFLLMDLDAAGHRAQANRVLNRFLAATFDTGDMEALAALPFFLSMRAALRSKISAISAQHLTGTARGAMEEEARRSFAYARDALDSRPVCLTVIGGLSGTGKTALAYTLAPAIGRTPGAVVLRSDLVRKHLMGGQPADKLPREAYQRSVTREVYKTLESLAGSALAAGHSVVVDAVYAEPDERQRIEEVARAVECPFAPVWLDAPLETRLQRVSGRSGDASDADATVVRKQDGYDTRSVAWPRVDASVGRQEVYQRVFPLVDRLN